MTHTEAITDFAVALTLVGMCGIQLPAQVGCARVGGPHTDTHI